MSERKENIGERPEEHLFAARVFAHVLGRYMADEEEQPVEFQGHYYIVKNHNKQITISSCGCAMCVAQEIH